MTTSHDTTTHSIEPEILDDELTPADLAFALAHLRFNRNASPRCVSMKGMRDYLVGVLRSRHGARQV
jgi:hypothetical protein